MQENYQAGDVIYLNNFAQYPFFYYVRRTGLFKKMIKEFNVKKWGEALGVKELRVISDFVLKDERGQFFRFEKIPFYFNQMGCLRGSECEEGGEGEENPIIFKVYHQTPIFSEKERRIWLFLSHFKLIKSDFVLSCFERKAKKVLTFEKKGAAVYLFERVVEHDDNNE